MQECGSCATRHPAAPAHSFFLAIEMCKCCCCFDYFFFEKEGEKKKHRMMTTCKLKSAEWFKKKNTQGSHRGTNADH